MAAAVPSIEKAAQRRHARARCWIFCRKPKQLLIGGKWVPSKSGKTFETINPANEEVLALAAEGDKADVDEAVKAARKAYEEGKWSKIGPHQRARYLLKIADLIEQHADELATLETLNNGMAISLARGMVARRGRYVPLLRRMVDQDLRRDQSVRPVDVQLHAARAGRRLRTDHSVERTDRDVRVEDRAGARLRQRLDPETGRADAAHRAAAWRADSRSRHSGRRGQYHHRLRRDGRRRDRRAIRISTRWHSPVRPKSAS